MQRRAAGRPTADGRIVPVNGTTGAGIGAVVALKPLAAAKSRLDLPPPLRSRLAWAMAIDTLRALEAAVDRVLVVSREPALQSRLRSTGSTVLVVSEPARADLNAALSYGAARLVADGLRTVVASVGDLPALTARSVARIVDAAAAAGPRAFVADHSGLGTTMLVATGAELEPRFQGRSAAAHHQSGASALDERALGGPLADARQDVDTAVDLLAARTLGVGASTAALYDPGTGQLGAPVVVTVTAQHDGAGERLVVTADGRRLPMRADAPDGGLRELRLGQRLHAVESGGRVISAWL